LQAGRRIAGFLRSAVITGKKLLAKGSAFSTLSGMDDQDPTEKEGELATSFRQSRKEFRFMLATWTCFAVWTAGYNGLFAKGDPGEPIRLVLGMPSWVFWGIALPWAVALSVTIWFAMFYMKDTDLGVDSAGDDSTEGEEKEVGR